MRRAAPRRCAWRNARQNSSAANSRSRIVEGTEEDIPADLIVSAVGQAVDFTGLEEFNNGKGAVSADKNYQVTGKEGVFVGGDIVRPHLLTTAIGHGSIAADGIDRFLRSEAPEKRPKIDVHQFDLMRKMMEKGLKIEETHEPLCAAPMAPTSPCTTTTTAPTGYVIPHEELFLGHFAYTPRNTRQTHHAEQGNRAGQLRGAHRRADRRRRHRRKPSAA